MSSERTSSIGDTTSSMDNRVSCLSNTCASAHVRHSNGKLRAQVKLLNLSTTQTDGTDGTEKQKQRQKKQFRPQGQQGCPDMQWQQRSWHTVLHRTKNSTQARHANKPHGTQHQPRRTTVHMTYDLPQQLFRQDVVDLVHHVQGQQREINGHGDMFFQCKHKAF